MSEGKSRRETVIEGEERERGHLGHIESGCIVQDAETPGDADNGLVVGAVAHDARELADARVDIHKGLAVGQVDAPLGGAEEGVVVAKAARLPASAVHRAGRAPDAVALAIETRR